MSAGAYDEILRALAAAGARFVLIGGLALNAWGVIRGTKDVDVVIARDPDNARAVASAAVALGGQVQLGDSFLSSEPGIASALVEERRVLIETRSGALDVVGGLPHVPPYEELAPRSVSVEIGDLRIDVCSRDDLRAMKRGAGRPQDLVDLENLDLTEDQA